MGALDYLGIAIFVVAGFIILRAVGRHLRHVRQTESVELPGTIDLSDAKCRERLEAFLVAHNIIGDANIRNGRVTETVPADALSPLVSKLRLRVNMLKERQAMGVMRGSDLYYADEAVAGQIDYRMTELDLECFDALLGIAERVVEDRKRSRSLYKGLSEGECRALVRVGLERYYRSLDTDYFSEAASKADAARRGELDNTPEAKAGAAILAQLFEIKGANE